MSEDEDDSPKAPDDRLDKVLKKLLPYRMAEDLSAQGDSIDFIAERLEQYLTASEKAKQDMADFHDSNGLEKLEEAAKKEEPPDPPPPPAPSAEELKEWFPGM